LKNQFQNWNWGLAKIGTRNQGPPARIGHAQDLFLSVIKRKIQNKNWLFPLGIKHVGNLRKKN
jgi:hypothetical protein